MVGLSRRGSRSGHPSGRGTGIACCLRWGLWVGVAAGMKEPEGLGVVTARWCKACRGPGGSGVRTGIPTPRTCPEASGHFVTPRGESPSFLSCGRSCPPAGRRPASPCNPRSPGRSPGCRPRGPVARRCGSCPRPCVPHPHACLPQAAAAGRERGTGGGAGPRPPFPFPCVSSRPPPIPPRSPPVPTAVAGRGARTCAWCVSAGKKSFLRPRRCSLGLERGRSGFPLRSSSAKQRRWKSREDAFGTLFSPLSWDCTARDFSRGVSCAPEKAHGRDRGRVNPETAAFISPEPGNPAHARGRERGLNPRALLQKERKTKGCLRRELSGPARGCLSPLSQGPPASLRGRAAGTRRSPRVCAAAYSPRRFRPGPEFRAAAGERPCWPACLYRYGCAVLF